MQEVYIFRNKFLSNLSNHLGPSVSHYLEQKCDEGLKVIMFTTDMIYLEKKRHTRAVVLNRWVANYQTLRTAALEAQLKLKTFVVLSHPSSKCMSLR